MQEAIIQSIVTLAKSDPTTSEEQVQEIHAACRRKRQVKRLVTTREACAILDPDHPVHPITLRRYAARGLLHPIKTSARRIRWSATELEQLAAEGTVAA